MTISNMGKLALAAALAVALGGTAWAAENTKLRKDSRADAKTRLVNPDKRGKLRSDAKAARKAAPAKPKIAKAPAKPRVTAKAPGTSKATVAAKPSASKSAAAKPTAPRPAVAKAAPVQQEVHWTQLPPSRGYPNGIPELRPEFLYPLPSQQPVQAATAPGPSNPGYPEMMP